MSKTGYNWSMSKSRKDKDIKNTHNLGPGEYNINRSDGFGRSCTMKGRYHREKPIQYQAAPGLYDIPDSKSKKGTIFKMESRIK